MLKAILTRWGQPSVPSEPQSGVGGPYFFLSHTRPPNSLSSNFYRVQTSFVTWAANAGVFRIVEWTRQKL